MAEAVTAVGGAVDSGIQHIQAMPLLLENGVKPVMFAMPVGVIFLYIMLNVIGRV
jgi:hypothetical protein